MIDYFALALGHGLLVLAFMRLVMRESLDVDPAITELNEEIKAKLPHPRAKRRAEEATKAKPSRRDERATPARAPRSAQRANMRSRQSSRPAGGAS